MKGSTGTAADMDGMADWDFLRSSRNPTGREQRGADKASKTSWCEGEADTGKTVMNVFWRTEDGREQTVEGSGSMVESGYIGLDFFHQASASSWQVQDL